MSKATDKLLKSRKSAENDQRIIDHLLDHAETLDVSQVVALTGRLTDSSKFLKIATTIREAYKSQLDPKSTQTLDNLIADCLPKKEQVTEQKKVLALLELAEKHRKNANNTRKKARELCSHPKPRISPGERQRNMIDNLCDTIDYECTICGRVWNKFA